MNLTGLVMGLVVANNLPPGEKLQAGVIAALPRSPVVGLFLAEALTRNEAPPVNAPPSTTPPVTGPQQLSLSVPSATGEVSVAYNSSLVAAGGQSPYTFTATGLPTGLSLNPSTGAITGTPTTPGTNDVTATVTDSSPSPLTTSVAFGIAVWPALSGLTAPAGAAVKGTAYSSVLVPAGGALPYTYFITPPGQLPPGLSLNATTGAITGIPTLSATFTFTAKVIDQAGGQQQTPCTITVGPAPPGAVVSVVAPTVSAPRQRGGRRGLLGRRGRV